MCLLCLFGFYSLFVFRMKEIPQVPMPGSRLSDPTPGELRGDPGGGDSERKAEPSAPNFTPTVADTVGSVGKSEQLGRNHGRKKSSRSTLTSLENSGWYLNNDHHQVVRCGYHPFFKIIICF